MASILPSGSTVLVTGITGYIGSHVADQLLQAGFKVRGTVRNIEKAAGLLKHWESNFGTEQVELVVVQNISEPGAFDEAVKGVSGIAHVASNVSFNPDPNIVITEVVSSVHSILDSAMQSSSVQSFVYTGSASALGPAVLNVARKLDATSYNEEAVEKAWAPPPYTMDRAMSVYAASKTQAEEAVFKYATEKKAPFVVNSIVLGLNFGKVLDPSIPSSSGDFVKQIFNGNTELAKTVDYQWFVDVQDSARLHVAALTNPDVKNERIIAYAEHCTWNDVLKHLRELRPNHQWVDDFTDPSRKDISEISNGRGLVLLQALGRPGWTSLADSLKLNLEAV
ncbi:NAD-dependent epimerase/dehydratase [Penicillium hordei]|uniref:NAD-dependent epimerase/dehydratase n=1 Tax=Penicillium hordei TaxID=40994 RepID=A0AAD6H6E9_9EURO|nr:NAD-dependent epimerase/dehydratase [Penicillium hordei]KAJ5607047.1 NAD-dependent epimerase/dehydratase [Penicillium hordei]